MSRKCYGLVSFLYWMVDFSIVYIYINKRNSYQVLLILLTFKSSRESGDDISVENIVQLWTCHSLWWLPVVD